jgi:cytochrome c
MRRALLVFALLACACHPQDDETARQMNAGNPEKGRAAIVRYGCGSCHTIPGVDAASGLVGPPLAEIADRTYIAGQLPNSADNMERFLRNPQAVEKGTAMPNLNVTVEDARDIAAYLYTLRR